MFCRYCEKSYRPEDSEWHIACGPSQTPEAKLRDAASHLHIVTISLSRLITRLMELRANGNAIPMTLNEIKVHCDILSKASNCLGGLDADGFLEVK